VMRMLVGSITVVLFLASWITVAVTTEEKWNLQVDAVSDTHDIDGLYTNDTVFLSEALCLLAVSSPLNAERLTELLTVLRSVSPTVRLVNLRCVQISEPL
jgi:hypothetical protein